MIKSRITGWGVALDFLGGYNVTVSILMRGRQGAKISSRRYQDRSKRLVQSE